MAKGFGVATRSRPLSPPGLDLEFANLVPLARANGSFECNVRLVYTQVYAYNRPEVTIEMVEQILAELERVKLLFRWTDAAANRGDTGSGSTNLDVSLLRAALIGSMSNSARCLQ